MCTLALLWKVSEVAPLVVAQCRDEALDRPARDVARWRTDRGIEVVAGRDLLAGGTWFGIGPRVVCGLTNRRDAAGPRRGSLSRGALVVAALEQEGVEDVEAELRARDGGAYGPFCLLAADDRSLVYAENSGPAGALIVRQVPPGVHVLGNVGLDAPNDPLVRNVAASLRELVGADEAPLVAGLERILGRRGEGWPNVHRPDLGPAGYGTRSAAILLQRSVDARLFTTEGAPDTTPWRDRSVLLRTPG
jgi:uncharacterized protein with NRDE domain